MADMRKICKCPNWVRHQPLLGKELTWQNQQDSIPGERLVELVATKIVLAFKRTQSTWSGGGIRWPPRRQTLRSYRKVGWRTKTGRGSTWRCPRCWSQRPEKETTSRSLRPRRRRKKPKRSKTASTSEAWGTRQRRWQGCIVLAKRGWFYEENGRSFGRNNEEEAIRLAEDYGTSEAKYDERILRKWRDRLLKTLKAEEGEGVRLKDNFMFKSPLHAGMWKAWIDFSGDPDTALKDWIEEGVPLGMNKPIPPSNGVFPPAMEENEEVDQTPELQCNLAWRTTRP